MENYEMEYMDLYEGLITSFNEELYNILKNIGLNVIRYKPDSYEITGKLTNEKARRLRDALKVAGWYVALPAGPTSEITHIDTNYWFDSEYYKTNTQGILIEPKYDPVDRENLPEFLYHVSPIEYRNKITLKGLSPRSKSKIAFHPERVYFATSEFDANKFVSMLIMQSINPVDKKPTKTIDDFDIWKIPTKYIKGKINIDTNFPLDKDGNSWTKLPMAAVFTTEMIPPSILKAHRLGGQNNKLQEELQRIRKIINN